MAGESNLASASRIPRAASRSLRGLPPGHLPPLRAPTLATREPPRLRPPQPRLPARTSAGRSPEALVPCLQLVPRLSPIRRRCGPTKISHPCFPPKVFPSADNFLLRFSGSARERTLFAASRQFEIPSRRASGLGSRRQILEHLSAFHHEDDAARRRDVLQRIAIKRHDVRLHPRSDGSGFVAQPQRFGRERRGRNDCRHGVLAAIPCAHDKFLCFNALLNVSSTMILPFSMNAKPCSL